MKKILLSIIYSKLKNKINKKAIGWNTYKKKLLIIWKLKLIAISTNEITYIKSQQRKIFNLKSMRRLYIENFYQFLTRCENILIKSNIYSVKRRILTRRTINLIKRWSMIFINQEAIGQLITWLTFSGWFDDGSTTCPCMKVGSRRN